jgi:hypothetical protein
METPTNDCWQVVGDCSSLNNTTTCINISWCDWWIKIKCQISCSMLDTSSDGWQHWNQCEIAHQVRYKNVKNTTCKFLVVCLFGTNMKNLTSCICWPVWGCDYCHSDRFYNAILIVVWTWPCFCSFGLYFEFICLPCILNLILILVYVCYVIPIGFRGIVFVFESCLLKVLVFDFETLVYQKYLCVKYYIGFLNDG